MSQAPEWSDSPYCSRCRSPFTMTNRKHHCRHCGLVFDAACSAQVAALPHYGILQPVRVCDGCKRALSEGRTTLARRASTSGVGSLDSYSSSTSSVGVERRATVGSKTKSKEDDDLQKAIAASLADVTPSSSTSGPASAIRTLPKTRTPPSASSNKAATTTTEEDPDLAAAIAASLRDLAVAPSAPPQDYEPERRYTSSAYQPYPTTAAPSSYAPLPSYDLTPSETTSLSRFTSLLSSPPPQLGSHEREIYEAARRAHPRLERGLEDTERRKELLEEMEGKLGEVTRLYEGLLREKDQSRGKK